MSESARKRGAAGQAARGNPQSSCACGWPTHTLNPPGSAHSTCHVQQKPLASVTIAAGAVISSPCVPGPCFRSRVVEGACTGAGRACCAVKRPDLVVVGAGGQGPNRVGDVLGREGREAGSDVGTDGCQVALRGPVLQRGVRPQAVGLRWQAVSCPPAWRAVQVHACGRRQLRGVFVWKEADGKALG